jgi:hypothetical protein
MGLGIGLKKGHVHEKILHVEKSMFENTYENSERDDLFLMNEENFY